MNGSLNKSYSNPIIIDEERLQYLSGIITEKFKGIYYKIETIDGASYKLNSLEEVLSYSNPQPRKIIKISIIGNKEKDAIKIYPDITVSLFDMSKYDKSCILSVNNIEEQEITFITQRIDEFVKGVRVSYWWLHSKAVYWIVGFLLYALAAVLYYCNNGKEQLMNSMNNTLFWYGVSFICFFFSGFVVKKCIEFLFPEGGFALGEQVKYMNKRSKIRHIILGSILGSLILGIMSGIIVHIITK